MNFEATGVYVCYPGFAATQTSLKFRPEKIVFDKTDA